MKNASKILQTKGHKDIHRMLLRSKGFSPRGVVAPQGSLTSKGGAAAVVAENEEFMLSCWIPFILGLTDGLFLGRLGTSRGLRKEKETKEDERDRNEV